MVTREKAHVLTSAQDTNIPKEPTVTQDVQEPECLGLHMPTNGEAEAKEEKS